ncbi:class I SAM-dependent methyltransferase [Brumimicrobium aurantiacum]|nr:class I SAM-dependent methyltransferase [Brumimicrobium aurantiacum]
MTEAEIRELENQLGCPNGEIGIEVGKTMNETNIGMTSSSIDFLNIQNKNSILELGHGNCSHLDQLLDFAENIRYFGLEISETMHLESKKLNAKKEADFRLYEGETIPFGNNHFDRIMSVNTIYFWTNPLKVIHEIERTLKQDGFCVITFANKDFMEKLPFVGDKFQLYNESDIKELVKNSNLKIIESKENTELVKSKTGDHVERKYTLVKLSKKSQ